MTQAAKNPPSDHTGSTKSDHPKDDHKNDGSRHIQPGDSGVQGDPAGN